MKVIKISDTAYKKLLLLKHKIEKEKNEIVSIRDVIDEILKRNFKKGD